MTRIGIIKWTKAQNQGEAAKQSAWNQIDYVIRMVGLLMPLDYKDEDLNRTVKIINTHTSHGTILPVYSITLTDGTVLTLRYNFYNWIVSVNAKRDVCADFMDIFDQKAEIIAVNCEGFPLTRVYNSYAKNKRQFTVELASNEQLYMFVWIFRYHYNNQA